MATTKKKVSEKNSLGLYVIFDKLGNEAENIKPFDIVYIGKDSAIDLKERYRAHFENETQRNKQLINRKIWEAKDKGEDRFLYDDIIKLNSKNQDLNGRVMDFLELAMILYYEPRYNSNFSKYDIDKLNTNDEEIINQIRAELEKDEENENNDNNEEEIKEEKII